MHVFRFGAGVLIGVQLLWAVAAAVSLDGTTAIKYQAASYTFANGDFAKGFVRFNNGFSIPAGATVTMDTIVSASGGFSLNDSGVLALQGNLALDSPVTLVGSGNIKGKLGTSGGGNTIFLAGNLTLAADTYANVFHITGDWSSSGTSGDLIIDGRGNTLTIGDRAQLFVDTNVTLTLRNMTIKTGPRSINNSPIQLAAMGSKLALDNVIFDLGADFHFPQGQIFIHNDVAMTGTSAFVYQSPVPSYITSGATWSFEQGTTFSIAPSTFTDCPFTVNNTYTNNAFLVLADASSALSLSGCSFQTTFTGLRLSRGMVLFDNRVAVDTTAGVALNSTTPATEIGSGGAAISDYPKSVAWSPDGRFLALVDQGSGLLKVYRFNPDGVPTLFGTSSYFVDQIFAVRWSPDARFIAIVTGGKTLRVYRFDGTGTITLVGSPAPTDYYATSVAWSPDGRFLVVANNNTSGTIQLFRCNGNTVTQVGTSISTVAYPYSVSWSPDGRFVALATYNSGVSSTIRIYRFNGSNLVDMNVNGAPSFSGANLTCVAWSPDGRYLAVSTQGWSDFTVGVYRFNGRRISPLVAYIDLNTNIEEFAWSPDGRYIAIPALSSLYICMFDGSPTLTLLGSPIPAGSYPYSVAWSSDGQYLASTDYMPPSSLRTFRCNYGYSGQPSQGFTNGLLFGDSAKGSAYNANVQINGGARVEWKGKIKDDAA